MDGAADLDRVEALDEGATTRGFFWSAAFAGFGALAAGVAFTAIGALFLATAVFAADGLAAAGRFGAMGLDATAVLAATDCFFGAAVTLP